MRSLCDIISLIFKVYIETPKEILKIIIQSTNEEHCFALMSSILMVLVLFGSREIAEFGQVRFH